MRRRRDARASHPHLSRRQPEPVADYRPPAEVALDTKDFADGEHRLRIEAQDTTGQVGVRRLQFVVRNGPASPSQGRRTVPSYTLNPFG
jgi:hypothetical protein